MSTPAYGQAEGLGGLHEDYYVGCEREWTVTGRSRHYVPVLGSGEEIARFDAPYAFEVVVGDRHHCHQLANTEYCCFVVYHLAQWPGIIVNPRSRGRLPWLTANRTSQGQSRGYMISASPSGQ